MSRGAEILLTFVLFAVVMSVIGAGINLAVPSVHAWLIGHVGQAGFWALLGVVAAFCAFVIYRDRTGKPKGT